MKKIILFLLIISCIFIKPNIDVKADAFSPIITAYEAIVTNSNGAKTYKGYWIDSSQLNDFVIPYNSEIMVISEESDIAKVKYNSKEYYIPLNDITLKSGEYSLSNAKHSSVSKKVLTIFETNMYSGPSEKFKKVTSIPKETELTYEYFIEGYYTTPSWVYVEYNGYKGWIQAAGVKYNRVATEVNYNVILLQDLDVNNQHIEKGTVLKCLYHRDEDFQQVDYVSYNGKIVAISYTVDSPSVEKTDTEIQQSEEPSKNDEQDNTNKEIIPDDVKEDKAKDNSFDYNTIIYLCLGAAALIALTSIVTIVLVNKKNSNKVNNESEQVVNEDNNMK